jgi:predicted transcriptional regulator of viral defense system
MSNIYILTVFNIIAMIYLYNVQNRLLNYMTKFQNYIKSVRAAGHQAFSINDAATTLGISRNAVICGMYKLKKKGDIISPAKNLYVILPPEHQAIGCLPADELVPILMKHLRLPYYVCLLSAALYHGASHQKPQVFQIMVSKQLKPIICGKIKIEFIYKKSIENLPIKKVAIKSGYLTIASPELTMMDLLLYPNHAGGLNHIATVLSELIEYIDPAKIINLLKQSETKAWMQRLGYILEHIESFEAEKQKNIIQLLYQHITKKSVTPVALAPELSSKGKSRNQRWMIIENTIIESDL